MGRTDVSQMGGGYVRAVCVCCAGLGTRHASVRACAGWGNSRRPAVGEGEKETALRIDRVRFGWGTLT